MNLNVIDVLLILRVTPTFDLLLPPRLLILHVRRAYNFPFVDWLLRF